MPVGLSIVDIGAWMAEACAALDRELGDRLLVVGLQGSMRRGEATASSDIDILIVLDHLEAADVLRCRTVLTALPDGSRAHGFTCGKAELAAWPRHEIFAFAQDVRCYHGELAPLLPDIGCQDVVDGARIAVSGLYHAAAHVLMSEAEPDTHRAPLQKMFFYALLQTTYLRTGTFAETRAQLLQLVPSAEATLLNSVDNGIVGEILRWAGAHLRELSERG